MSARILENGVAICGETHHARWCETEGLVHDKFMAQILRDNVKDGDVVVNIGAHIGSLAYVALDQGATVFCFEPNTEAVLCLEHNLKIFARHTIIRQAIGDRHGKATLTVEDNAGATYLTPSTDGSITVTPLDDWGLEPHLILADCEGWELNMLRGAEKTINRFHPKLLIEINEGALQRQGASRIAIWDWLQEHGYENRKLQDDLTYTSPQFDVLCTWKPTKAQPQQPRVDTAPESSPSVASPVRLDSSAPIP